MADMVEQAGKAGRSGEAGRVDIVIVNWNAGDLLRRCLQSIADHGGNEVASVVVVDNGSTDGSADIVLPVLPLEMVRTGVNLGFGRACNLGVARGSAPFVLFFNPDAELMPHALAQVVAHMTSDQGAKVGVCGIRLVDEDGVAHRHCARFPGVRTFLGNSLGLTRALRRWFPPVAMSDFDHLADRSVDHVMGAFYLMRRPLFEQLGGFDEDYFVYLEDLDLSKRVKAAGYSIDYLVEPTAFHKQGGTSEKVKAHRLFYALNSNMIYSAKHLSRTQGLAVAVVTLLVEPVSRTARAILRGSAEELSFTLRGFGLIYRHLPQTLTKLRRIAKARKSPSAGSDAMWREREGRR